jgi:two-component system nitrogen regulation sensor histidine kinase NtrY
LKRLLNNPYTYLSIAFLLMLLLLFTDKTTDDAFIKREETRLGKDLQNHLREKKSEALQLFNSKGLIAAIEKRKLDDPAIEAIANRNFYLVCTRNDSLFFWNSNQAMIDSSIINQNDSVSLVNVGQRSFLVCKKQIDKYQCFLLYTAGDFSDLTTLAPDNPFVSGGGYVYDINHAPGGFEMTWSNGDEIASFNLIDIEGNSKTWVVLGILFLLLISFLIFKFIEISNLSGLSVSAFFLLSAMVLFFRILLYQRWILQSLQNSELFNPEIYASSFLLPSLGDLILNIISFLVIFYGFTQIKKRLFLYIPSTKFALIKAVLICTAFIFCTDLVFSIIKSLVVDSNISFHFADLPKINIYSFLGMTVIGIIMGGLFYIASFLFKASGFKHLEKSQLITCIAVSFLFYALFQTYNGHLSLVSILTTLALCSIILLWFIFNPSIKDFYLNILILLIISGFSAFIINYQNKRHEQEYLNVYANKIVSNQDLEAESKFAAMEQQLIKEFITPQDFQNFFKRQDEYEKRIKNLFFSGYLDKYELKILSFDSTERSINLDSRFTFKLLDRIYSFQSFPTISNHFYQIKNKTGVRGYIAKFETCNLEGSFGSVFLLLQPKIIQSSHSYPDIFNDKKQQSAFEFKDYSYALYQNKKLVSQKGDYPYHLAIPPGEIHPERADFFTLKGYKHFISSPQAETTIIISKRQDYLVKSFALFSFMFIFFTTLGVLFALIWASIFIARFGWQKFTSKHRDNTPLLDLLSRTLPLLSTKQRLLSSRIQMSMVGLVFFGLVVSVFFTIQYVRYNYNQRQQDQLFLKLKEILNQLENEPDLPRKLRNDDRLKALVNQLSDANRIDLNIFDASGLLLASTQPGIYSQYLLAPVMNPTAFFKLRNENASQLLQKEKVTDFEYLSGYVPLFDDEKVVKAYLNLPYFTEKSEIDKEISSFLVSLINIYFLLLLIAIVIAYFIGQRISLPLQLIREKLSKTTISSKNQIIEWKRDDEIGQLVKQYNKMVMELEESAHKLSESEREGAWKEMARQVAHEIKNPLTPMKLNIQHLQRAWGGEAEKLDVTFKRVTAILIEQIDSLSRLATEFSSFAKMPTDMFEDCRIDEILLSTIHLFEQSENVEFIYDKKLKPAIVYTDPDQIGRVFTNIFKNAIQSIASDKDGIIHIAYTWSPQKVVITIKDNGEGMADDIKAKIFVPSFSTKNSGMGLGLAISKKIVENSGGKIGFTSEKGKGSSFFVELPVKQS